MAGPAYREGVVFAAACLGMLLFGIVLISLGSILPLVTARFGLDLVAAGSLSALLPLGILLGSMVFGPVVDLYGYKGLMLACALLIFVSLEGIAFAQSAAMLRACVLAIGFGGGMLNGATNALVAELRPSGRGAGLSLLGVFFGIGALGMPAVLGILSPAFSPGTIVADIGFFIFLCAAVFALIRFPAPKLAQGFPIAAGLGLLRDGTLVLCGAVLFFESGMEGIVNNWATTYLQREAGSASGEALFALTAYVAGLTLARLLLSRLLKQYSSWSILPIAVSLTLCGGLLLAFAGRSGAGLPALVLLGIGFAAVFPILLGMVGDLYPGLTGTAFSLVFVMALTGNTGANYLVGRVGESYGLRFYPAVILGFLVVMSILLLVTHRTIEGRHAR